MTPQNSFRRLFKLNARLGPSIRRNLKRTFAVLFVSLATAMAVLASISFVSKWGTTGAENGNFQTPTAIAVDAAGNVYVAEGNGNRVQKFDGNGSFILKFGVPGSAPGGFV